jgi:hypothetical protein
MVLVAAGIDVAGMNVKPLMHRGASGARGRNGSNGAGFAVAFAAAAFTAASCAETPTAVALLMPSFTVCQ